MIKRMLPCLFGFCLLSVLRVSAAPHTLSQPGVTRELWGKMSDGREVALFTLTNAKGLRARVTEYGAILVSMETPDRKGKSADVTHGYDTLDGW